MTRGVIYYNTGTGCVVRLLVSLHSLRKHYAGPVTILSEGDESHELCKPIAAALDADLQPWDCGITPGKHRAYLAKTRYHEGTPYETTIALDSDTLVTGKLDELFQEAETHGFCVSQLGDWRSDGKTISSRIRQWEQWLPDFVEEAVSFGPAINCGVVAFRKDTPLYQDWMRLALPGRDTFIPDEVCCQIVLHRYPHRVLDGRWNRSCKHDDPDAPDTRVIHYHGRKHCRSGLPFHGDKWVAELDSLIEHDITGVSRWLPAGDKMLGRYLSEQKRKARKTRSPGCAVEAPQEAALQVILGARHTGQPSWVSTDRPTLDIASPKGWKAFFGKRRAKRLLAEHVWNYLSPNEGSRAAALAFKHLEVNGCLRIAVPDGFHPSKEYIASVRPGGSGPSAEDHKVLYDFDSLTRLLEAAGFTVVLLEYWDAKGGFFWKNWEWSDGYIARSFRFDRRNRNGKPNYTSLIVDAIKPPKL